MEFNEKLQQLRKQKSLTQEELAEQLFVSRTAISKWESGRGLPNIDSLKAISKVFGITIDELLSGDDIIQAAEEEKKENAISLRTILYGLFDVMSFVFFFIPLFGERKGEYIESVSLFSMRLLENYIFITYVVIIGITVAFGIVEITLQNYQNHYWKKYNVYLSMVLTILATIIFIISQQPYIAFFEFWILVIKGVMYLKQQ
mgnify:CR=1 FL=1|jgi:transcriptional regulator with XRE-family HTH domain